MPHNISEKEAAQELGERLVGKVAGVDEVSLSYREDVGKFAIQVFVRTKAAKDLIRKQFPSFEGHRVYVDTAEGDIVFFKKRKKSRPSVTRLAKARHS